MKERLKKTLLLISSLLILSLLLGGGYWLITQQTEKKLRELEKETKSVREKAEVETDEASFKKREINLPSQVKKEKNSSLYLQTDNQNPQVGEEFSLQIIAQTPGETVDGAQFTLTYNPEVVQINQPLEGQFFSLYPQKNIDSQQGKVRVIALQAPGQNEPLSQTVVVSLPVVALTKGTAQFNFLEKESHLSAQGGQDILQKTEGLRIEIR